MCGVALGLGSLFLAPPSFAAIGGGGGGISTTLTSSTSHRVTSVNLANLDAYSTRVTAHMDGGALIYDQTFAAAPNDPVVLAAFSAARARLTSAGARGTQGPTLLSSSDQTTSVLVSTVEARPVSTVTETIGPLRIMVNEDHSTPYFVLPGTVNVNVNSDYETFKTYQPTVTHDAVYGLTGFVAGGAPTVLSSSAPLAKCGQPFRRLVSKQSGALKLTGSVSGSFGVADKRGTVMSVSVKGSTLTVSAGGRVLGQVTGVFGVLRVVRRTAMEVMVSSSDGRFSLDASYNSKHGTRVVAKVDVCTFSAARNQLVGVAGGSRATGQVYLSRATGAALAGQTVTITDGARTITVHTGNKGVAAFSLPAGPDRSIELSYAGSSMYQSATLKVQLKNHAHGTIRLTTSRLPKLGLAVFAGKVVGRDGKPAALAVTLQYLTSRTVWRTVATTRSKANGVWSAKTAWPRHGHLGLTQIYYRIVVDSTPTMQINALLP